MTAVPNFFLGVLLAGAAALFWGERGQFETNEAPQRLSAQIAQLSQRAKDAETRLGQLDQRAKAAETRFGELDQRREAADTAIAQAEALLRQGRPQLEALRGEAASDRAELSRVQSRVAGIMAAQPTLLAKLEEQQREFLSRIEALQQRATADRSDIAALQTRMVSSSDEQVGRAAELQERQKELLARVDRLQQQASADRTALVQLAGNALDLPRVASAFERRQADLADQLSKVREEISADRSALGQLEGQVDAIRRASVQRGVQSEETASIAPGIPNEASEADPPAALEAAPKGKAALAKGAAPRVVLRIARNKVAAHPAAKNLSNKPRVDRRFASRKHLPIRLDQTDGIFFIDQADEMSMEYQPVPSLLPAPAGVLTATIDPAADGGRPWPSEGRYPKGSKGCDRYKTYDAQTLTYRGYDGVVRPCRPL
jgi:uncharacterized coiled-coil DUF342 family protein